MNPTISEWKNTALEALSKAKRAEYASMTNTLIKSGVDVDEGEFREKSGVLYYYVDANWRIRQYKGWLRLQRRRFGFWWKEDDSQLISTPEELGRSVIALGG
jgi:hypothetical protein